MAAAVALCAGAAASAHQIPPEAVVQQLRSATVRDHFGVTEVERSADLPRMLVIRVGPAWNNVPAAQRRAAAENWLQAWRHTVDHGILAIIDANGAPLVNFDATGRAALQDPPTVGEGIKGSRDQGIK